MWQSTNQLDLIIIGYEDQVRFLARDGWEAEEVGIEKGSIILWVLFTINFCALKQLKILKGCEDRKWFLKIK